jgi:hypothetical protein
MNNVCVACEPAESKSRIMAIYEQLQELGSEVFELQRVVDSKRVDYYAIDAKGCEKEKSKGGIVNDIDWAIDDIKRMVLDIREYVEVL